MRQDQIDWLQGEALADNCPPLTLHRNGTTLEQHTGKMTPEQQHKQREMQAVFRRKFLRAVHGNRHGQQ